MMQLGNKILFDIFYFIITYFRIIFYKNKLFSIIRVVALLFFKSSSAKLPHVIFFCGKYITILNEI